MRKKWIQVYAVIVIIGFGIVMLSIPAHFVIRNVIYERLGICESWMSVFLRGDAEFAEALHGEKQEGEHAEATVQIDWETQYPFGDGSSEAQIDTGLSGKIEQGVEKYTGLVQLIEDKIDYYCTEGLFFYPEAVNAAAKAERVAGCTSMNMAGDILQMQNGYLTYTQEELSEEQIKELAGEVADFNCFLSEQGIPFIYANAGSKVCPYDKQLEDPSQEYTNENGDRLVNQLKQKGIEVIDFRDEMQADQLDWYDCYYKTDHHWKTQMGLWAASKLAAQLNNTGKFSFDQSIFETDQYSFQTYDDCFLGGQGKAVTLSNAKPESYTKIIPKFKTSFMLQIPTRNLELSGDYEQVLFDNERLQQILSYTDEDYMNRAGAYDCARARNDAMSLIRNQQPKDNAHKKVLMLQDSFAWYSSSFLACDIEAVDVVHLPAFTGSIRSYIEQTQPDAVIMMYCERNIAPIDWNGHDSTFDLR